MNRCLKWFFVILTLQACDCYITLLAGPEYEINPIAIAFLRMNLFPILILLKLGTAVWLGTLYALLLYLRAPRFVMRCYEIGLSLGVVALVTAILWNLYCYSTYM